MRTLPKRLLLAIVILSFLFIIFALAPLLAPYDYNEQNLKRKLLLPNRENLFGTDHLGRDIFSRVIYGGRISLPLSFLSVGLSLILGLLIGTLAGYSGKIMDEILMRITDAFFALPSFIMAMGLLSVLGPSPENIILAIVISNWPKYARMIRASIISIKNEEFIVIPRLMGASHTYIVLKHLLPNAIYPTIPLASFDLGRKVVWIASLGFLGLGVQPPTPEWGSMIKDGLPYALSFPHLVIFPSILITIIKIASVHLGEGFEEMLSKGREKIEL